MTDLPEWWFFNGFPVGKLKSPPMFPFGGLLAKA
jgi:hypothetical protein